MDGTRVVAGLQFTAFCTDAGLMHKAAIVRIAGIRLIKLTTQCPDDRRAEKQIIDGF